MGVTGSYELAIKSPMGDQECVAHLNEEGELLTGTMEMAGNSIEITNGKVDGDSFTFQVMAPTPMGDLKGTATGKVEGDDISGELKLPLGKMTVTGKRI